MQSPIEQLVEEGLAALRQCIAAAVNDAIDAALAARIGMWPECRACCERRANQPAEEDEREPMATREQLVDELQVDLATIDRWRDSGELQSFKFRSAVRFRRRDVDDFVERHLSQENGTRGPRNDR